MPDTRSVPLMRWVLLLLAPALHALANTTQLQTARIASLHLNAATFSAPGSAPLKAGATHDVATKPTRLAISLPTAELASSSIPLQLRQ